MYRARDCLFTNEDSFFLIFFGAWLGSGVLRSEGLGWSFVIPIIFLLWSFCLLVCEFRMLVSPDIVSEEVDRARASLLILFCSFVFIAFGLGLSLQEILLLATILILWAVSSFATKFIFRKEMLNGDFSDACSGEQ